MFLIPGSLSDLDNNDPGYCTDVCCNQKTEETCYDYDDDSWWESKYCAEIADGGCPCRYENQVKCGQGKITLLRCVANENYRLNFISIVYFFPPTRIRS
jgi:hypothetical protein